MRISGHNNYAYDTYVPVCKIYGPQNGNLSTLHDRRMYTQRACSQQALPVASTLNAATSHNAGNINYSYWYNVTYCESPTFP